MQIGNITGTNLVKGINFEDEQLTVQGDTANLFSIPYPMIRNAAIYHNNELEIHIPFEQNNEQHDVLCEMRFFVPTLESSTPAPQEGEEATEGAEAIEEEEKESFATKLYKEIKSKANVDKNIGSLVAILENLPLSVPRGRYTAELYTKKMRLHGTTYNYKIDYKNIRKAFLLPMPDENHMEFVIGFDKPLRQGTTSYPYILMNFKKSELIEVALKLGEEKLKEIHPNLKPFYTGKFYETVAKLFKMIVGINIIIPGKFATSSGSSALRCNIGHMEGYLFPLMTSMIFIKKPVMYLRLKDIARVEFHRVSVGSMRNFDFEVIMKSGHAQVFSGADKKELEILMAYFKGAKIAVHTIKEENPVDDIDSEEDGKIEDDFLNEEDDEDLDDDFVAPDGAVSDEEGDEDFTLKE